MFKHIVSALKMSNSNLILSVDNTFLMKSRCKIQGCDDQAVCMSQQETLAAETMALTDRFLFAVMTSFPLNRADTKSVWSEGEKGMQIVV